ncbi:hypothetical protein EMCRGX_G033550 [Ephydatia muelleri]
MISVSVVLLLLGFFSSIQCQTYVLDDSVGLGRRFDGIGGLSGGGATSRLLVSYPEPQLSQILDLLFKPLFGASLHILKVEIGGDAQTTDGTESSHMHSATDENYERGYEWWLMVEAKKRNPNIKLYGLPWAFPAWVGQGTGDPYAYPNVTASYIVNWLLGAQKVYGLPIDYVGIWNERNYNTTYIKTLYEALNKNGLQNVKIVAADGNFLDISVDILADAALAEAVSIVGAHYPGTYSDVAAISTHKQLWASEDYSTYNDDVGAGCWARILNQNYVNGNMSSTISWNLIASYYNGLPFFQEGLMTAIEPWSGHYEVMGPVWISAHTTQFTEPGYNYLKIGSGAGHLVSGGSYVTFISPDSKDFTIVIETMTHDHSICIRPSLPPYNVQPQSAKFQLKGSLANIKILNMWVSHLYYNGTPSQYFIKASLVQVSSTGTFTLNIGVDTVITLSTLTGQQKGSFSSIPSSEQFPSPYMDNFDGYPLFSEANYFADQAGVFEIISASDPQHKQALRQVVPTRPITWCNDPDQPITIIGNISWVDVLVGVDVLLEPNSTSAFVAARISAGGCGVGGASGIFFWISVQGTWELTSDIAGKVLLGSGSYNFLANQWYSLEIIVQGNTAQLEVDRHVVGSVQTDLSAGYVGLGAGGYYGVQFDNFYMEVL